MTANIPEGLSDALYVFKGVPEDMRFVAAFMEVSDAINFSIDLYDDHVDSGDDVIIQVWHNGKVVRNLLTANEIDTISRVVIQGSAKIKFQELTTPEKELISDTLNRVALEDEQAVAYRALGIFLAHHEQSIETGLADNLSRVLTDSERRVRSLRNLSTFLRRNRVVVHTHVLIPEQGA